MGKVYMSDERLICELRAKVLLLLALTINTKWYSSSLLFHHYYSFNVKAEIKCP